MANLPPQVMDSIDEGVATYVAPLRVYMAGKMVKRDGGGGDNKCPGDSYRPFSIFPHDNGIDHDSPRSPVEGYYLFDVPIYYTGPWQGNGSNHGLIHGITDCGSQDPRVIVARAFNGIRHCEVFFALLDGLDCYGTLAEIGYAKALGKQIIVGVHTDVNEPGHIAGSDLWFAIQMADYQIDGSDTDDILRKLAQLLSIAMRSRGVVRVQFPG